MSQQLPTPQITVSVIDRTTVRVSGLSVAHALGYQVKIGTLSGGQVAEQVTPVDGLVEFADRSPRTVYYVTARALGDDEAYLNSDWAAEQAVTTGTLIDEDLPQPQIGLTTESFTALKVTVLTAYKEYRYNIAETEAGLDEASPQIMGSADGTAYLMGLDPGTTYYVRFCLVDGAKCSLWSDVKSATTSEITNTIEVTSGADGGAGTLRQAMNDATNGTKIVLNVDEITLNSVIDNNKRVFVVGGLTERTIVKPGNRNQLLSCQYADFRRIKITGDVGGNRATRYATRFDNCVFDSITTTTGAGYADGSITYKCLVTNNTHDQRGLGSVYSYNCVFSDNTATYTGDRGGGAIGYGTLVNCAVTGNSASNGGGVMCGTLFNCYLYGNKSRLSDYRYGGGGASAATLISCNIVGNTAAYGGGTANCTLNNCVVADNIASNTAGGVYCYDRGSATNCVITGNTATTGGGTSGGTLTNCVISGNTATTGGGASGGTLTNCLVSGNKKTGTTTQDDFYKDNVNRNDYIYNSTIGVIALAYRPAQMFIYNTLYQSISQTPTGANANNICYADAESDYFTDDYKLAKNSPAIAAGDVQYVTTTTDLAGNPRTRGGTVDCGCYQFEPYKLAVPSFSIRATESGQCNIEYSVPEEAEGFNLQYADNPGFDDAGEITAESTVISLTGLSGLVYFRGASKGDGLSTLDSNWTESQTHYFDTTAPIVTVSRTPIEMTYGETVDFKAGVEVIDDVTGEYPIHYQVLDSDNQPVIVDGEDTDIRTSGIPIGNYMLQISASDAAGNIGYADRGLAVLPPRLATPTLALKSMRGTTVTLSGLLNSSATGWEISVNNTVKNVTPNAAGQITLTDLSYTETYTIKARALGDWVQPPPPEMPSGDWRDSLWSPAITVTVEPPEPEPSIREDRLESVRARIAVIRGILADTTYLTEVSIDGISERIDRRALADELRILERQEIQLMYGSSASRFKNVDTSRA